MPIKEVSLIPLFTMANVTTYFITRLVKDQKAANEFKNIRIHSSRMGIFNPFMHASFKTRMLSKQLAYQRLVYSLKQAQHQEVAVSI